MRKPRARRERRKAEILKKNSEEKVNRKTEGVRVFEDVKKNAKYISDLMGDSSDLITRFFTIQYTPDRKAALIALDGMVDSTTIDQHILKPLMREGEKIETKIDLWEMTYKSLVEVGENTPTEKMKVLVEALLSGDVILFIDGYAKGMAIDAKGWKQRGVEDPRSESVVRGSREGFTETLRVDTALIRRRLKDPDLRLKDMKVGERTKTDVTIMHIEGLADEKIVKKVQCRIEKIDIDGILESGYIEEMIQDTNWSPFPVIQNTERPDVVVGHLLEGKVAVVVDGTPNVLVMPAVFAQFYHSAGDYYEQYMIATFLRLLRLFAFFIALSLPAFYIAFIAFHPDMVPGDLAMAMAAGRSTVPFPSIVEAVLMEISVEILREASIRLPGPIGPTIGIVGALVIGESAVNAGLVSPLMVIVVALTTISSYANPSYNAAISLRLIRFPMMIAASIMGLYGIMLFMLLLLLHLIKIRSFGVPYLSPFSPLRLSDVKDSLIRVPWPLMNKRPVIFRPGDDSREGGTSHGKRRKRQ